MWPYVEQSPQSTLGAGLQWPWSLVRRLILSFAKLKENIMPATVVVVVAVVPGALTAACFLIQSLVFGWIGFRQLRSRITKKMAPVKGPFSISHPPSVIPVTVTFDDYRSVAVMPVPAAMQPAVMVVKLGARAAIVVTVAIIIPVAADAEAKALSARGCRRCNRDDR
jgi:hypothetical protein